MKSPRFDYVRAGTLAEAVEVLAADDEAVALAGGQSLVPLMNMRLARPTMLVDLNELTQLDAVEIVGEEMRLGAMCRHRRLEFDPEIASVAPLMSEAAGYIGHPQVRNRGTLGGSLAHGDPASELGCALLALGGSVVATGSEGTRSIEAASLFEGFLTTALAHDELITDVVVPVRRRNQGHAFTEFSPRAGDFATVGIAVTMQRSAGGQIESVRVAAAGLGGTVCDLTNAVENMIGAATLSDSLLRDAAQRAASLVDPSDDVHVSADHRRELVQVLLVRALMTAWARSEEST